MVSAWIAGALQGAEKGFAQKELMKQKETENAIKLMTLQSTLALNEAKRNAALSETTSTNNFLKQIGLGTGSSNIKSTGKAPETPGSRPQEIKTGKQIPFIREGLNREALKAAITRSPKTMIKELYKDYASRHKLATSTWNAFSRDAKIMGVRDAAMKHFAPFKSFHDTRTGQVLYHNNLGQRVGSKQQKAWLDNFLEVNKEKLAGLGQQFEKANDKRVKSAINFVEKQTNLNAKQKRELYNRIIEDMKLNPTGKVNYGMKPETSSTLEKNRKEVQNPNYIFNLRKRAKESFFKGEAYRDKKTVASAMIPKVLGGFAQVYKLTKTLPFYSELAQGFRRPNTGESSKFRHVDDRKWGYMFRANKKIPTSFMEYDTRIQLFNRKLENFEMIGSSTKAVQDRESIRKRLGIDPYSYWINAELGNRKLRALTEHIHKKVISAQINLRNEQELGHGLSVKLREKYMAEVKQGIDLLVDIGNPYTLQELRTWRPGEKAARKFLGDAEKRWKSLSTTGLEIIPWKRMKNGRK
jgi:hypothetical protein